MKIVPLREIFKASIEEDNLILETQITRTETKVSILLSLLDEKQENIRNPLEI